MGYRFTQKSNNVFEVQGLSHVALIRADMKRTVAFYQDVLGFPLVKTVELPGASGQHFFFDMGGWQLVARILPFPEGPGSCARSYRAEKQARGSEHNL